MSVLPPSGDDPFIRTEPKTPPPPPPFATPESTYFKPGPSEPAVIDRDYSGWWRRVAARLLDGLIMSLPTVFAGVGGFAVLYAAGTITLSETIVDGETITDVEGLYYPVFALMYLISLIPYALYEIIMVTARGQTVGKIAAGIKIVDQYTAEPPTAGKAALRFMFMPAIYALALASSVPLLLSLAGLFALLYNLWPLWDKRKQGLHDKVAGTLVIKSR